MKGGAPRFSVNNMNKDMMDETFDRLSGLDIQEDDNASIYSGGRRGDGRGVDADLMDFFNNKRGKGNDLGNDKAKKMANAWETFGPRGRGEPAPRHADAISECDERER